MGLLSRAVTANSLEFHPGQAAAQGPAGGRPKGSGADAVRDMIWGYWIQNSPCQGIVLGLPKYAGEAGVEQFFAAAASIAASFGGSIRLPSKNILILFSHALDRELLVHRLTKTLRTRVLISFDAVSPGEIFSRIQPWL